MVTKSTAEPPIHSWLLAAVASGGLAAAVAMAAPHGPSDPYLGYFIGCIFVVSESMFVSRLTPASRGAATWASLAFVVLCALGWLQPPASPWSAALATTSLLVLCSAIGASVGNRIRHPGHLLFVAWIGALADVLSLLHPAGPSRAIANSARALSVAALPFPLLGTSRIVPFLGGGDVVFVALFVRAAAVHRLGDIQNFAALLLGFAGAFGVVVVTGAPVPVLPFMGAAVVLLHPAARVPPREDLRRALPLALLLTGVILWLIAAR